MIGLLLASGGDPLSHVIQQTVSDLNPGGGLWSFPLFSNHIFMQIVAAVLLIALVPWAVRQRKSSDEVGRLVPKGFFGNAIESVCMMLRSQIFLPNLGKYTDTFSPYLWSLFFFILFCNLLGMIPLADWFAWVPGHWVGGTPTGNLYTTATLAVATLILVVYNGLRYHGMDYVKHFFMGPPGINIFIAVLEIAGLLFKTMALCVRLFANMLAGHIVLAVFLSFIPATIKGAGDVGITLAVVVGCILFNFLEILVAFLHAFIFTTLTAVFIGQAVNIHHDDHHDEEHGEAHAPAAAHAH